MKVRSLLLLLVLVLVAGFTVLNWQAFMTPTTLSLGLSDVQAPLGLVMLGLLMTLTAMFLLFVVYLQTSVLFDARHHARELRSNRELADKAEASRFTELRAVLERELKQQTEQNAQRDAATRAALLERMDLLDRTLRTALEQSESSLNAYVGELEDRLEKSVAGQLPSEPPLK
jgi:uncharacterized integral membrane protein